MSKWLSELIGFIGACCLCTGCYLIYPPVAWIVAGIFGVVVAGVEYPRNEAKP